MPINVAIARMGKEPRRKVYARMAADDCISINRLAKSYDIKQGLLARGYEPFDSPNAVASEITKYAKEVKATVKSRHYPSHPLFKYGLRIGRDRGS